MRQLSNILSSRLLAAVLAGLLLCMPAFAWGDLWGKSSVFEVQKTNDGLESLFSPFSTANSRGQISINMVY